MITGLVRRSSVSFFQIFVPLSLIHCHLILEDLFLILKEYFFTFRILFLCLLYKGLSQYVQIYIFDVSDDTSLNIVKKIFNVFEKNLF